MYTDVQRVINGECCRGSAARRKPVGTLATGRVLARVCHASTRDLDPAPRTTGLA